MYKMKPLYELPVKFNSSSTMYKMKNIMRLEPVDLGDVVKLTSKTESDTDPEAKINNSDSKIASLLNRQQVLLEQCSRLKEEVALFLAESLCDGSDVSVSRSLVPSDHLLNNVVIIADPDSPPYSLIAFMRLWNDRLNAKVCIYFHDSINESSENVEKFNVLKNLPIPEVPKINIALIWKRVGVDCQLIISPFRHVVRGEANLLRYLDRRLSCDNSAARLTMIDTILDDANCILNARDDSLPFVNKLADMLDKNEWFAKSNNATIADLAVWSAVSNTKYANDIPKKLKKWYYNCAQLF